MMTSRYISPTWRFIRRWATISSTPYSMHEPPEPTVIFKERPAQPEQPRQERQVVARQVHIKPHDIETHGYTKGCPKCDHERNYGPGRSSRLHSQACRERIMAELAKTPQGMARIQAASQRLDRTAWEIGRHQAQGEDEIPEPVAAAPDVVPDDPP